MRGRNGLNRIAGPTRSHSPFSQADTEIHSMPKEENEWRGQIKCFGIAAESREARVKKSEAPELGIDIKKQARLRNLKTEK